MLKSCLHHNYNIITACHYLMPNASSLNSIIFDGGGALGETVAEFVVELCRLAKHCEIMMYIASYLDEMLRDRFVCGLNIETMWRSLLTEAELLFAKALDFVLRIKRSKLQKQVRDSCRGCQYPYLLCKLKR